MPKAMLGTPRRTVLAGIAALVVATILLLAYLSHYRSSIKSQNANVPVLVAKVFIPAGTTADSLARKGLFQVTAIPKDQLKDGAITDAAALHGQVALADIYPAQQLTVADFGVTATSSALSGSADLLGTGATTGTWRALALDVDASHGITPQAQTGDRVDVYVQVGGTLGLLMPNVLILAAPNQVAAGTAAPTSSNYILRVPTKDAARFAYAVDNGKIWFLLRPQKSAKPAGRIPATSSNVFSR
jgi:Flp pilus assembly protein CpaB